MSGKAACGRASILALGALLALPPAALGWGKTGHRVVGQVAQEALSAEARRAVLEITGGQTLPMIANWPDFARSNPAWDFVATWHWVTVEDGNTVEAVLERSRLTLEPDNVVEAIDYLVAVLEGDGRERRNFQELVDSNRAALLGGSLEMTALSLLTHFTGDLHQPLHVGRGGDRGGNNIRVNFFGEIRKLHSVWDDGIIDHQKLGFSELTDFLQMELAGQLEAGDGGVESWARESKAYRGRLYEIWSRTDRDNYLPELGWLYVYDHLDTVKRRLYLGGLRLARVLNEIYR